MVVGHLYVVFTLETNIGECEGNNGYFYEFY